jgi:hypothetical protein
MELVYKRRAGENPNPSYDSKYSDGRIGWRKFEIRHPNTIWKWEFSEHGDILGLWQLAPPQYLHTFIPIQKIALFRTTKNKNNPEGFSSLRRCYRAWYMKKNLENLEAVGAERDLAGLPVAKVPPDLLSANASPQQQAQLAMIKNIIVNLRRDEQEGLVWPLAYDDAGREIYKIELLASPGQRQFDSDKIINRYRQSMMMTFFADFLLLGHNSAGNRSIVEKRSSMFCTAIGAFLDIVADEVNRDVIPKLFRLNPDIECSDYPKLLHGELSEADLDALGNYFLRLSQTGMPLWPNPELQKHLMEAARAPTPVDAMRIAEELEVQPQKVPEPGDTVIIPADPESEPTQGPEFDVPTPGIPPVNPGEASLASSPYPIPPGSP